MGLSKAVTPFAIVGLVAVAPVKAHAFTVPQPSLEGPTAAAVTPVRYRGHRHHRFHHRRHGHFGRDLAFGLGLGLLGSAIASHPPYYADDARSRCAARFKSFEWETGLYTSYGGDKRVCPYLR